MPLLNYILRFFVLLMFSLQVPEIIRLTRSKYNAIVFAAYFAITGVIFLI